MPDTFTPLLNILLMATGGHNNTWGSDLNASVISILENSLAGYNFFTVTGGSYSLTDTDRQARTLEFGGTLTGNQTIVIPNKAKSWIVKNGCGGAFLLQFKTATGAAVTIPVGWSEVWCDGSNNVYLFPSTYNFTTQMGLPDGTLAIPGLGWASETGSGMRRNAASKWRGVIGGVDVFEVTAAGLEVLGDGITTGIFKAPSILLAGVGIVPSGAMVAYGGITPPAGWLLCYGQTVSRATYANLFAAIASTQAAVKNGTAVLTGIASTTGMAKGMPVSGTGVPGGALILSVDSPTQITLTQVVAGSGAVSITVAPYGIGDGSTTFNIPDRRGRTSAAPDAMGGTAANRLTDVTNWPNGANQGQTAGEEKHQLLTAEMASHTHAVVGNTGAGTPHSHGLKSKALSLNAGPSDSDTSIGTVSGTTTETEAAHTHPINITPPTVGSDTPHNNLEPMLLDNWIIKT